MTIPRSMKSSLASSWPPRNESKWVTTAFKPNLHLKMCVKKYIWFHSSIHSLLSCPSYHKRELKRGLLVQAVRLCFDHFSLRKSYLCTLCRSIGLFGKWLNTKISTMKTVTLLSLLMIGLNHCHCTPLGFLQSRPEKTGMKRRQVMMKKCCESVW